MKLAIDIHHLSLEHAGTKRVTINIIEYLKMAPGVELIVLKPGYALARGKSLPGKLLSHGLRFFWVHMQLPVVCLLKKIDVLLSPEFNTPLFTICKRAVIAHDAHIRAQKEYTSTLWFYCYYVPFIEYAIRKADMIFTVSAFARKQIIELMHLDEQKVHVIYNGIDKRFNIPAEQEVLENKLSRYGLEYKKYILFVGTFESRKNIERLLEAFALVKKKHTAAAKEIKLAVVGKAATKVFSDRSKQITELIRKVGLENEVVLTGFIHDDELPCVYQGACMIAFPSLHEGFGFPIVEGFASGVPVLTSNVCAMPEIAGDAALLVDPYHVEDIAGKMERILFDLDLQKELIQAGLVRVNLFTWEGSVKQMLFALNAY